MIVTSTILISCAKLLLLPAYRSTDFEVHRNWLAITHSLPLKQWYYEDTSEWTLDYPPLFAWFEFLLSQVAKFFDKDMLIVGNLNYASQKTIVFQRLSVIVTDLLFSLGIYKCSKSLSKGWRTEVVLPIILVTNAGLLMVDHIHFQYNGFMYGILLLSISYMIQDKYLLSAFWFTVLLNLKHIYVYMAPAYFVYLLRNYCLKRSKSSKVRKNPLGVINIFSFIKLSLLVMVVFIASFGPFYDHIGQVLSRLFPFKRGLCHAYWAPNFWALYNTADKAAVFFMRKLNIPIESVPTASMTGGLVQEFSHIVLPNVQSSTTMILSGVMMLPAVIKLWVLGAKPLNFVRCLVLCALTSFLFGWHVHEKAILMAIIPLSILAVLEVGDAKVFLLLATVGHYSLFPLLFENSLLLIKVLLLVLHSAYAFYSLSCIYPLHICKCTFPLLNTFESVYLLGLVPLCIYENFVHSLLGLSEILPFLPLMMTSLYCSAGVVYCWLRYYLYFLYKTDVAIKVKRK